jgi:pilus assembly protein Flp/PilA
LLSVRPTGWPNAHPMASDHPLTDAPGLAESLPRWGRRFPSRRGGTARNQALEGGLKMEKLLKLIVAIQLRAQDLRDKERGATATEYAILVAFIALLIILGVTFFGDNLNNWFHRLGDHVNNFNS